MTVASDGNMQQYAGDGSTTAFSFPYLVLDEDHIVCVVTDADDLDTTLTLTSGFTVSGVGSPSGVTVTTVTTLAVGETLTIERVVPLTQEADYVSNDAFPAESHEKALDKLTMAIQQINRQIGMSPRMPASQVEQDPFTRAQMVPGYVVGVNAGGQWDVLAGAGSVADAANVTWGPDFGGEEEMSLDNILRQNWLNVKRFGAVGDGVTDDGPAINAATYHLYKEYGGGVLYFPEGIYQVATTLLPRSGVNWVGQSATNYLVTGSSPTVIRRDASLLKLMYQSAYRWGIYFMEFRGNGGFSNGSATYCFARTPAGLSLPADDPLRPGTTTYPVGSGVYLRNVSIIDFWYGAYDGTSMNAFDVSDCQFRTCKSALAGISDSRILNSTFSGCTYTGLNVYNGGIRISGNLFEFNRSGANADEAAHGIVIWNSANEIQIDNNRFDRNAGHDIYMFDGTKRPRDITITGNSFMRAAWGTDVVSRASIYMDSIDRVAIVGNQFYAANANPSSARGAVSPRAAILHSDCTALVIKGNQFANLARELDLATITSGNAQAMAPVWTLSGSGTGVYYMTDLYDPLDNPWVLEPTAIVYDGSLLRSVSGETKSVTGIVGSDPGGLTGLVKITSSSHGFTSGQTVTVSGVTGTTEANGTWVISNVTSNTFTLAASVFTNAYVSGGTITGEILAGDWCYGDYDSLGFDTIYIRNASSGDVSAGTDIVAYNDVDPVVNQMNSSSIPTRSTDVQTDDYKDAVRYATDGRVSVAANGAASIVSNQLRITVADGHGIVAGDLVYVDDVTVITVTEGVYTVASVADAGGGNDYIYIDYTAADAGPGTADLYTISHASFVLRTRRRCMTNHVMPVMIRFSADQATTTSKALTEFPVLVSRGAATAMATIVNGTALTRVGSLSTNFAATSSDNNLSIVVESDYYGDKLTITVYNSTAYSIEYTAEII